MKKLIWAALAAAALIPAAIGLLGNPSLGQSVPVQVPSSAQVLSTTPRSSHPTPSPSSTDRTSDDHGGTRTGTDDPSGDDHGGTRTASDDPSGDDHGGSRTGTDDPSGDDHGGSGHGGADDPQPHA